MAARGLDPVVADLAAFELFVSVVELGSLSSAARRHGVSQPAISVRLRGLERRLGIPLLIRSSTGCRPTPDGLIVARSVEPVLAAAAALAATAATIRSRHRSAVRLAASLTVAEHLLPGWLSRLRSSYPTLAVELMVENSDRVIDLIRSGQVELGFIETPDPPVGLDCEAIAIDHLVVICAPGHPWARRRRPVTPAELGATPLVVREEGAGGRQTLQLRLAQLGIDLVTPAAEVASPAAICAAVAAGVGPGVLSNLAADADLEGGHLRSVEVSGLDLGRQLRAVWRPPRRPASLRWLLGT
jgi:DNA-binding transcriptional LysR family regulator